MRAMAHTLSVDAAEELVDDLVDGEGGARAGWGLWGIGSIV